MSLTALMERVHSDGAIPPGRKYFLLMVFEGSSIWKLLQDEGKRLGFRKKQSEKEIIDRRLYLT